MSKPFISIITINYNNLDGLKKTFRSVIDQTWKEFEYIIIDGGSTDGSAEFIKSQEKFINYWISESDAGIYNAMNKGIAVSKGDYLLFLNSGDALTSNIAMKDFISHEDFSGDIIYGDYKFKKGEKIYPDNLYPGYFMKTSLPHQSTFFKSSVFEDIGVFDETYKISGDRAFFTNCFISKKICFKHVNYFLTLYDLTGISNNSEYIEIRKMEDLRLLKEGYGDKYYRYKEKLDRELRLNTLKRNSIKGIYKRLKRLWNSL